MEAAQFEQLMLGVLSVDEATRKHSEEVLLELLRTSPDAFCVGSVRTMRHSASVEARQMAAVLFRRYAFHSTDETVSFFLKCSPETQAGCKKELVDALVDDGPADLRHKVCDAVAAVAKQLYTLKLKDPARLHDQSHVWPELFNRLWECAQSSVAHHLECALRVFATVPSVFGGDLPRYRQQTLDLLRHALHHQSMDVRVSASQAYTTFIIMLDKQLRQPFAELLPLIIESTRNALVTGDETSALSLFESLADIAQHRAAFMRNHLQPLIDLCVMTAQNAQLEDSTRNMAGEVLVILTEEIPVIIKKHHPDLCQKFVPVCFAMMCEVEDEEGWSQMDAPINFDDDDTPAAYGEQAVDRMACALSGTGVAPIIFTAIPHMLVRPDWQARHAALMVISCCAEGCRKKMQPHLGDLVNLILPLASDPHPRVRFALCNALGQLASDFAPRENKQTAVCFQSQFHHVVVPAILHMMEDGAHPRVQAHASSALVNFMDGCSKTALTPHLDNILSHLSVLLSSPAVIVQEAAITSISSCADAAEDLFCKYYQSFMPQMKMILQHATEDRYRMMRGKTMECASFLGLAVGKEMFFNDAREIMLAMSAVQQSTQEVADDPQTGYMLASCARICQVLGEDFMPFTEIVLPPLLKSMELEPELKPLDPGMTEEDLENSEEYQFIAIDDQRIGIKTSSLEEKKTACEMLCIYARELGPGFAVYVDKIWPVSVKLLTFYIDEGVRMYSAMVLPHLLEAVKSNPAYGSAVALQLWQGVFPTVIDVCAKEFDMEALSIFLSSLKELCEVVGVEGLPQPYLSEITRILNELLVEYIERSDMRKENHAQDEEHQGEDEYAMTEDDEIEVMVLRELSDCSHALFDQLGEDYLPYFDNLAPLWAQILAPPHPWWELQWALCAFDDVIEACGPKSFEYSKFFLPHMLSYINHHTADVCQAAAYGVGVMSVCGGPEYVPVLKDALPRLLALINDPQARTAGNVAATENAISAVVKIVREPRNGISVDEFAPTFLSWLPTTEDVEEAEHIYGFLVDLMSNNNPVIVNSLENFTKSIAVLCDACATALVPVDSTCGKRITGLIKDVSRNMPPDQMQTVLSHLSQEQQQKFVTIANS
eukprot:m.154222 g.154222  ORF g.154222 m.154222 type:complete len:1113 (+) comp16954_c0_seq1:146-3484(+)